MNNSTSGLDCQLTSAYQSPRSWFSLIIYLLPQAGLHPPWLSSGRCSRGHNSGSHTLSGLNVDVSVCEKGKDVLGEGV